MVAIMVGRGGAGNDGRGRQVKQRSGANTLRVVSWHCVKVLEFQFGTHQEFWEFHFGTQQKNWNSILGPSTSFGVLLWDPTRDLEFYSGTQQEFGSFILGPNRSLGVLS